MTERQSALLRLLHGAGASGVLEQETPDLGFAENRPYPFLAIVGQVEMRTALLLSIINPAIGGVLLIGPRGTAKTTAVRSLTSILPDVQVSDCEEAAFPEDLEREEAKYLFPDCYEKYHSGQPIYHFESVKLVELPLNARLEDVVGGINERVAVQRNAVRLERGILGHADNNILYIDEVNLLDDQIVDAILDASAQGSYTVRRGAMVGTYRSRFVLIGSMNPEEGRLRPQIMDRFGLRVNVRGLLNKQDRIDVYQRVQQYRLSPTKFVKQWEAATTEALEEVLIARELLKETNVTQDASNLAIELVLRLEIDSSRAEYALIEAARAHAAADGRTNVGVDDVSAVAPMALRQRRSEFMVNYFDKQLEEDQLINQSIMEIVGAS